MKINRRRVEAIRKVIQENYFIADRVKILTKRGYTIKKTNVGSGGIGKVFDYPRSTKLQIGSADLYGGAYAVIFDPIDHLKAWDLNNKSRWGYQKLITELTEEEKNAPTGKQLMKLIEEDNATIK